jgi:hypothetical protein
MIADGEDPNLQKLPAKQFGWLRRPDLDIYFAMTRTSTQAWEKPDGAIHHHDPRNGELILFRKVR